MSELRNIPYTKSLFRCFRTIKTSQNLLDDIGLSGADQEIANGFFYQNGLEQAGPTKRVFERSAQVIRDISAKFKPENWSHSRFCDGQWSVLYTAESQQTSLREKMYHTLRFYKEESQSEAVNIDLAISKLAIETTKMVNLVDYDHYDKQMLQSPDMKSYSYCQKIARACIDIGAQAIRSCSARDSAGFCVPIFDITVIKKDYSIQKYIKAEIVDGKADLFYPR